MNLETCSAPRKQVSIFGTIPKTTRTGTMPKQGDIVLVPIPFTDLSSTKRRPVIVISNDHYQATTADMLVVAMTSNLAATPYSFLVEQADLVSGTLKHPSRVRVDKIYSLAQSIAWIK